MDTKGFEPSELLEAGFDVSSEENLEGIFGEELELSGEDFPELDEPQADEIYESADYEADPYSFERDEFLEGYMGEESDDDFSLMQEAADYQVIGRDTRKRIGNTKAVPFRHICKLSNGCTGSLIAPNKVLTAAHCVYNRKTGRTYRNIRAIPGKNGPGTSTRAEPFGSARAIRLDFPRAYASARTYMAAWPHDFAVITLDQPIGRRAGWWKKVRALSSEKLRRLRLNTAGYPGDKGGQHLYWTYDRVVSARGSTIEYLHDTARGQSGSPVWLRWRDTRTIVAIHVARDDAGNPGASPIVANRGVALTPTILATIRGWVNR